MNTVISYDAVRTLLANPPSINPCPNFFNIRELRKHFAKALKKIPCPQSAVNGWAGAVMSPEMYALIDQNVFHLHIAPTTTTPAYLNKFNPDGANVPYSREEKSTIDAKFESTARATTHLRSTSTTPTKLHRQRIHQKQDGTRQCLFATSSTRWHQRTASQHLTQCARTTPTSWKHTIHKTLPKSYSSDAPTPKRLRRWPRTRTPPNNSSSTRSISSRVADCTNAT
jgi:hypothetical protein